MQSVSAQFLEEFASPAQSPRWKLEVLASSGYNFPAEVEISATASSTKNVYRDSGTVDTFFKADNVGDGQAGEPLKYAVCDLGVAKTDSGFVVAGEGAKYGPGWWSEVRSDANGNFANPPTLEVVYTPALEANRIRVSTTSVYSGAHTINIQVWYAGDNTYTDLGDYTFGTGVRVVADLGGVKTVAKIRVRVKRTKAATQYARLTEVEPVVEWSVETLGSLEDWCEDIRVRKSSGAVTTYTPASPGFGVNELSLAISKEAPLTPAENQLVFLSMGYGGEYLPQGVFLVSEVVERVDYWNITAHGFLSLAAYHRYPDSVFQNIKPSVLLTTLLEWLGISGDTIDFHLASDTAWEWYVVEGGSCDDTLRQAASALGVAIYETEDSRIQVRSSYGAPVLTITDALISDITQTKPREINYVTVHYGNIRAGKEDVVLTGKGDLAASETKTFIFRMSRSPCMKLQQPYIESFKDANNNDLTLPTIMASAADAYSLTVKVRNNVATAGTFTIKLYGTPLDKGSNEAIYEAKDVNSIRRRGIRPYEAKIYTNSATRAKAYGDALLKYLKGCSGALTITLNRPAPHLQLRDVVHVDSDLFGLEADYTVAEIYLTSDETELSLLPKGAVV